MKRLSLRWKQKWMRLTSFILKILMVIFNLSVYELLKSIKIIFRDPLCRFCRKYLSGKLKYEAVTILWWPWVRLALFVFNGAYIGSVI